MTQPDTVLVLTQNLFFLPRIEAAANACGLEARQVASGSAFWDSHRQGRTALVLVDLEGDQNIWTEVVSGLKREKGAEVRVIAYGPHGDTALLDQARALGCDAVLIKGVFAQRLQELMETRGAAVVGS